MYPYQELKDRFDAIITEVDGMWSFRTDLREFSPFNEMCDGANNEAEAILQENGIKVAGPHEFDAEQASFGVYFESRVSARMFTAALAILVSSTEQM